MKKTSRDWIEFFIPAQIKNDIEAVKSLRLFLYICAMVVVFMSITTALRIYGDIEYGKSNYIGPSVIVLFFLLPFIIKLTKNTTIPIYCAFLYSFAVIIHRAYYDEFLYSTALIWLLSIPSLAMIILGSRKSIPIMVLSFFTLTSVGFLHYKNIGFAPKDPQLLATYLFVMFFITLTSHLFKREKESVHEQYLDLQLHSHKKERLTMLGEMVAGLAHEINNPLTIIVASSNLIEKELIMNPNSEITLDKTKRLNQKISFHAARINRLIASLREYSKNEQDIRKEYISLNDLIHTLSKGREEQLIKAGIDFRVKTCPEEITVHANYLMLRHAILNLIENSIDAVTLYEERWIEIELKSDQNQVEIYITDSGLGIKPEYQNKIMNAFFTTKDIGKGVGIGLLVSSRYLELNRATLQYNKNAPHTQFVITLPYESNQLNFAKVTQEKFKKAA